MTGRTRVAAHAAIATMATSSALAAVFDGYGWVAPVCGGIALVFFVSELVRRSPLPAALGPLLSAAAVTCYITALYAGAEAYGHVVPSIDAFGVLRQTARDGFSDVRALATPVPTHRGLVLITVVALAAVALVVDLFAVTMRRAALAGLPLLAVFALCTSVSKHGAGWLPFALGAAGFLWLLLADSRDRLARWGRSLGVQRQATDPHFDWSDDPVAPSPLSVLGRRIGLTAIVLGVALPMLVPGLRGGVPKHHGHGLGGTGSSTVETVNPIVQIKGQLTSKQAEPVMTVRSSAASPPYLRLTSLDRFDGNTFSPSPLKAGDTARVANGIDAPDPQGTTLSTVVTVGNLKVYWLPLPVQVESVQVSGDWRFDPVSDTVFSSRNDTRHLHYAVMSITPQPTAQQLRDAVPPDPSLSRYTQLPKDLPPSITTLTQQVTANAHTAFDQAVAIQHFLTSKPFVYDTNVAASDSSLTLEKFLLQTHRGFCQQYAAAMAVMARVLKIPSRVAVGFTHGTRQPDGSWLVTTHDAHAWPELYFAGAGWVAFEPTPRGDGQAVVPSYARPATQTPGPAPSAQPGSGTGSRADRQPPVSKNQRLDQLADNRGVDAALPTARAARHATRDRVLWALLALVLMSLTAPSLARAVSRRRRWSAAGDPAAAAEAAWAELRASAIDAQAGWVDGLTPRATARVLQAECGGSIAGLDALGRLVAAVERAWYAADAGGAPADSLRADLDALRPALFAGAGRGRRLVLRVWPRSTLQAARDALGRVGAVLDALDLAGARLRARLRPRGAH